MFTIWKTIRLWPRSENWSTVIYTCREFHICVNLLEGKWKREMVAPKTMDFGCFGDLMETGKSVGKQHVEVANNCCRSGKKDLVGELVRNPVLSSCGKAVCLRNDYSNPNHQLIRSALGKGQKMMVGPIKIGPKRTDLIFIYSAHIQRLTAWILYIYITSVLYITSGYII